MTIPLPPMDDEPAKRPQPTAASKHLDDVPTRSVADLSHIYLYVVKVALSGSDGIAGWCFLTHARLIPREKLDRMVEEAAQAVNEIRLPRRREQMASQRVPVHDAPALNEQWFGSDAEFFEAVMCDKFDFRKARYAEAEATLDPTVRGWKQP